MVRTTCLVTMFVAVVVAALWVVPPATAKVTTLGSDLSQKATVVQSHPTDWAAWVTQASGSGSSLVMAEKGEVTSATFKGTVQKPEGYTRYPPFHFWVAIWRPAGDGTYDHVSLSPELQFPFGGDPQQKTTFALDTDDGVGFCVRAGDIVTLTTSGGFGTPDPNPVWGDAGGMPDLFFADGYRVQMFADAPGATTAVAESDRGDGFYTTANTGKPQMRSGQELLMNVEFRTGDDSALQCVDPPKTTVTEADKTLVVENGSAELGVSCESERSCRGSVYVKAGAAQVATGTYDLKGNSSGRVELAVNANGQRKLAEAGGRLGVAVVLRPKGQSAVTYNNFTMTGAGADGGYGSGDRPDPVPVVASAEVVKPAKPLRMKKGRVAVAVRCVSKAACTGKLTLFKGRTFFGAARFGVPGGRKRVVAVKLNANARRAMKRAPGKAITAKATAKLPGRTHSVLVKLRAL